jgi:hydroxyacylglutathione hydrolase
MILRRFYDDRLAQASWLVGCAATGEALIVDPNRDIESYLDAARREGLEIAHVTETHIHADFVSGTRELAARTGATMYLSDEGGPAWRYGFHGDGRSVRLRDGDVFMVGNVRIQAVHTPGHTPEHMTFVLTDTASADAPMGAFTGDFIFAGDVGRPDLLERAAGHGGTMREAARTLFRSLQRFRQYPDWMQLWPGHGAGSACGKALGAVPSTTLGYEKRFNWAFGHDDIDAFADVVLAGQPEPPKYFAQMKRINRDGPPVLGAFRRPDRLPDDALADALAAGALLVDARSAAAHAAGHVPGTLNIPLNRSFNTWAGWLVPCDADVLLLVDDTARPAAIDEAVRDLSMVGLDRVAGWFGTGALDVWRAAGRTLATIDRIDDAGLAAALENGAAAVIDVRGAGEWQAGHLPGARNIPLGHLADRLDELPRDRRIVLQCQTGARSAIAASLLRRHGIDDVANLEGGITRWARAGRPVEPAAATEEAGVG